MTMITHFAQRCHDRGLRVACGDTLKASLEAAIAAGDDTQVEFVMWGKRDARIYRILTVGAGRFYVIVSPAGSAMTLYTQEQVRWLKGRRKFLRRIRSMVLHPMEAEA